MTKTQWLNMPVHVDPAGKKISTNTTGSLITIERRKAYELAGTSDSRINELYQQYVSGSVKSEDYINYE
tara:strand:+ start:14348 stop:14554 length:207 start_codon:yes stop_codon:yes gene_type:complete